MIDIFNDNAFGLVALTDAINKVPEVPALLTKSGLFTESSVSLTTIAIESKEGQLALVTPTPRGAPGNTVDNSKRTVVPFIVPHFEINGAVYAEEVQNVRAFGSETVLDSIVGKVNEKLTDYRRNLDATREYNRVGAVKGIITYAGGQTLNLYTAMGVSQPSTVDLNLDAASPVMGDLRKAINGITRDSANALDGTPVNTFAAICGSDFFDALVKHPEVRETYLNWQAAAELRGNYVYGSFEFAGVLWQEYKGTIGGTPFVAATEAYVYPVGVPGLFRSYNAPADWNETVNTMGLPFYARQWVMDNGKGIHLDAQMNSLSICTQPKALRKVTI